MDDRTSNKAHLFPTTRWTQVALAGGAPNTIKREALELLLRRYVPALRSYLLRKKRIPTQYVDDLVQGFIVHKILEKDLIAAATRGRGRFRNFIRTVLDRYVVTEYRQRTTAKRNAGRVVSLDDLAQPVDAPVEESDRVFDVEWARTVLTTTLDHMQATCQFHNRQDVWTLFELRLIKPMLHGEPEIPYSTLVQRLGLRSPSQATNLLTTGKRMFIRTLHLVIGEYADSAEQIDQEIHDLFKILPLSGSYSSSSFEETVADSPSEDDS